MTVITLHDIASSDYEFLLMIACSSVVVIIVDVIKLTVGLKVT